MTYEVTYYCGTTLVSESYPTLVEADDRADELQEEYVTAYVTMSRS